MRIRYTLRARADIEEINEYLQRQAPAVAQEVVATIRRGIELLGEFPYMAPATDEPGVRQMTLTRQPYRIYYRIEADEVQILHIRHARRRPLRQRREPPA